MAQKISPREADEVEEVLDTQSIDEEKPRTAEALYRAIQKSGLIGMWKDRTDITDSGEYARQLRERAQRRRWD